MKRCLFITIVVLFFFLPSFLGMSIFSFLHLPTPAVHAQTATPPGVLVQDPTADPSTPPTTASPGEWIQDPTVTFLGKTASRAASFMDWTLVNYKWDYLDGPLVNVWTVTRNIVYTLLLLVVLIAAFFIVISGGNNVGVLVFARKFIFVVLLVTFSFAIVRFLYQLADIFQVFFFNISGNGVIAGKDIVSISFSYQNFTGFRKSGIEFDEAAFVSLLLIKISAVTFYVIGCILTVRKIILWFFLAASPLYPIIILYFPVKSTVKIIRNEFIRWLLYAPLFSLFLSAIVIIWKSNLLVLPFQFQNAVTTPYPTAISILLGGPGQRLGVLNNLNYPDTFIQYVVALLMLWVAILMPFILLQLFLDFLSKYDFGKASLPSYVSNIQNSVLNSGLPFLKKPPAPSPLPTGKYPAGQALEIPRQRAAQSTIKRVATTNIAEQQRARQQIGQKSTTNIANINKNIATTNQSQQNIATTNQSQQNIARSTTTNKTQTSQVSNVKSTTTNKTQAAQLTQRLESIVKLKPEVAARATTQLVSFPIPTMRDIVKFETANLKRTQESTHELQLTQESLTKIANPKSATTPAEQQHFTTLREKLNLEKTKGDVLAKSILSAASTVQKPQEAKAGVTTPGEVPQTPPVVSLPVVNEIQTVSFDDYEAVKELWLENYQQIDVPSGEYPDRLSWIKDDGENISEAITLLSSPDPLKVREGLASVSNILPFLLIGGFSQTEVIAYLKAKLAAGKLALEELEHKEEEQETLLDKGKKKAKPKALSAEMEADEKEKTD